MIILDQYLSDPVKNKSLVDILHELDRKAGEIKIIDSNPTTPPERVVFAYNRVTKQITISDTDEIRVVGTEKI